LHTRDSVPATSCPGDKEEVMGNGSKIYKTSQHTRFGNSYILQKASGWNVGQVSSNWNNPAIKLDHFKYPTKKVSFHTAMIRTDRPWAYTENRWHNQSEPYFPISFIDGHAEYFLLPWKPSGSCPGRTPNNGYY